LEHGKPRGSHRQRAEPDPIDLGNDPPLSDDGATSVVIDRRRVSVRWYAGTILSGLCGAALMGGAVYVALDGEAFFAAAPERAEPLRGSLGQGERAGAGIRKSDRMPTMAETQQSARQTMRVSTTVQVGEREVVRVRPFVRVAANLSLSTSELSAGIGAFNPNRVIAAVPVQSGGTPAQDEASPADDAEISFVMRDLGPVLARVKMTVNTSIDEVMARVREAANWGAGQGGALLLASAPSSEPLALAPASGADPYAGLETRIVPENITLLPKTAAQTTGGNMWNEKSVIAKKGDTVVTILREFGATADEARAIAAEMGPRGRDGGLKEGQKLRVLLTPAGGTQRSQPIRIIVMGETAPEYVVALSDTGKYVSVDVASADTPQVAEVEEEEDENSGAVRLYQSIYETALRNQVPRPLVDEMIRIYSYDVDFQRRVQPGDSFEILYPGEEEQATDAKAEVLYASLTVGGETKRYYRFYTPDDNTVDYYDEAGKSAKKFLVRKPVEGGIMRSPYGWRRHPILGYSKMHTGVDWAAPRGTPIFASGNGAVEKVGWEGGYGKYVRIKHTYGYETAYGHMSAFARGIQPGAKVRQGQVIGYVGSTGLSTGPHVHYEVLVNGRFVDPVRIKLPRGRSLEGPILASFEKERDKVDGMMNRPQANLLEEPPPIPARNRHGPRREASKR
jgi:murein DD-endopeptidase MepM/ murein hydrolase activator NlpD